MIFQIILTDLFVEKALIYILREYWYNFTDLVHDNNKVYKEHMYKCYNIKYEDDKLKLYPGHNNYNQKPLIIKNITTYEDNFYVLDDVVERSYYKKLYYFKDQCVCNSNIFRLIANDVIDDRLIMATNVLKERIENVRFIRKYGISEIEYNSQAMLNLFGDE